MPTFTLTGCHERAGRVARSFVFTCVCFCATASGAVAGDTRDERAVVGKKPQASPGVRIYMADQFVTRMLGRPSSDTSEPEAETRVAHVSNETAKHVALNAGENAGTRASSSSIVRRAEQIAFGAEESAAPIGSDVKSHSFQAGRSSGQAASRSRAQAATIALATPLALPGEETPASHGAVDQGAVQQGVGARAVGQPAVAADERNFASSGVSPSMPPRAWAGSPQPRIRTPQAQRPVEAAPVLTPAAVDRSAEVVTGLPAQLAETVRARISDRESELRQQQARLGVKLAEQYAVTEVEKAETPLPAAPSIKLDRAATQLVPPVRMLSASQAPVIHMHDADAGIANVASLENKTEPVAGASDLGASDLGASAVEPPRVAAEWPLLAAGELAEDSPLVEMSDVEQRSAVLPAEADSATDATVSLPPTATKMEVPRATLVEGNSPVRIQPGLPTRHLGASTGVVTGGASALVLPRVETAESLPQVSGSQLAERNRSVPDRSAVVSDQPSRSEATAPRVAAPRAAVPQAVAPNVVAVAPEITSSPSDNLGPAGRAVMPPAVAGPLQPQVGPVQTQVGPAIESPLPVPPSRDAIASEVPAPAETLPVPDVPRPSPFPQGQSAQQPLAAGVPEGLPGDDNLLVAVPCRPTDARGLSAYLNDPVLMSMIERLIAANPSLNEAMARIESARAMHDRARADLLPQINAKGDYQYRRFSQNGNAFVQDSSSTRGFDWYSTGFDTSWEIDLFGRLRNRSKAAGFDARVERETYEDVLVTLIGDLMAAYVELCVTNARHQIALENVKMQLKSLEITRERKMAGEVGELDVAQAEAQLQLTVASLPELEEQRRTATNRLLTLQGLNAQNPAVTQHWGLSLPVPGPVSREEIPASIINERPDIRAARMSLAAQESRIRATKADRYPRITLNGTISLETRDLNRWWDETSVAHNVGPGISWNVVDFGRNRASVRAEQGRYRQTVSAYRQAVLEAAEEVQNALLSADQQLQRSDALAEASKAARRVLEIALVEYREGLTTYQNVLDAQRQYLKVEESRTLATGNALVAHARLYKALGGYWWVPAGSEGPRPQPLMAHPQGLPRQR